MTRHTRLAVYYRAERALDPYIDIQQLLRWSISLANEDLWLSFESNQSLTAAMGERSSK